MENTIETLLSELKAQGVVGIENTNDLIATLKDAAKKKEQTGTLAIDIDKLKADLMESMKPEIEAINKNISDIRGQKEAENLEAVEEANIKSAISKKDEAWKKKFILEHAEGLGLNVTDIVTTLGNNTFRKQMTLANAKLEKDGMKPEDIKKLREIHDLALCCTAAIGGIESRKAIDTAKLDMQAFNVSLNALEKAGYDVPAYRKAAGDAFDTQTATDGLEWLPVNMSRDLVEAIFLPLILASQFRRIAMTSKVFRKPRVKGRPRAGNMAESLVGADLLTTKAPISQQTSADITFTAQKLGVAMEYSDEIEEDAIVELGTVLYNGIQLAIGSSIEDMVLNGTTLANDLDNAVGGGDRLWVGALQAQGRDLVNGIRKKIAALGTVTVDAGNAAQTINNLRSARAKMGRYGKDPKKLVLIANVVSIADLMNMPQVLTREKYGDNATIITGELAQVDGIPIIVSEFVYTNLAATGLFTNANGGSANNRTAMYLVYIPAWEFGDRRMVRLEQDRFIMSQQSILVASWRGDLQKVLEGETTEAAIINCTSTP